MKVERLHVQSAPGLPDGLPELEFAPGLTVVVGPNASGKSTLARTLRELLWPAAESSGAQVSSRWRTGAGAGESTHAGALFAGQVHWQPPLEVPAVAGAAPLARFGVRTLLETNDGGDQALAKRVATALAGGLDLEAAARRFATGERLRKNAHSARARDRAESELHRQQGRTKELAALERELAGLQQRIDDAEAAGRERVAAEALCELVQATRAVARLETTQFTPGLERLVGDELDRSRELESALERQELELSELETQLADLAAVAADNAFPGDPPERQDLDAWTKRLEELALVERKRQELALAVAAAEQRLEAGEALVFTSDASEGLSSAILSELAQGIARLRDARAELQSQRTAAASWEDWAQAAGEDPAPLREALLHLRSWLRSPQSTGDTTATGGEPSPALAWVLVLAGSALAVVAAVAALPWLFAGLFLSGAGAALLWASTRAPGPGDQQSAAATFRRALEHTPFEPGSWEPSAVEAHLADLEGRLGRLEQADRAAQQLSHVRRAQSAAEDEVEQQAAALGALAARVGADPEFVELGAVEQVHALVEWLDARAECTKLAAELAAVEQRADEDLWACSSWMVQLGAPAPIDVPAARAGLLALGNQRADLIKAREDTVAAQRTRDRVEQQRAEAEQEADGLWERAQVERGDLAALTRRLDEHTLWLEHRQALRDARARASDCGERYTRSGGLSRVGEQEPESVPLEQVQGWIAELTAAAAELRELSGEAGRIRAKLQHANEGHELADCLADVHAAEQQVATERELAVVDALARELLDEARAQHETAHAPPTLQRAQDHFARFTHGGWRLEVLEGEFRARDVGAGAVRTLEQLSDGTRAQLLLAVRLAALEELEPAGEPVPICLDETLSITDPTRFRAIASALLELADGGRQILYFTADPGEAAQWLQACRELQRPEPRVLDLAVLRGEPEDWGGVLPAQPPTPDGVPAPTGLTSEEYARALDVHAPDGFQPADAWHLYFLAHDDLAALAACLRLRITRIGHWDETVRRKGAPSELGRERTDRLRARSRLAHALADLWRIGRGRPVTWEDVTASKAVSETFVERVRELLALHARDPHGFAGEVRGLKGFRAAKADELDAYLEQVGCLPAEPSLPPAELTRRCLQAAPEAVEALGPEDAASFTDWLAGVLRS